LLGIPDIAIITEGEDFESVLEIELCLKPGKSNSSLYLWLLVPGLTSPLDKKDVQRLLLPSITKRSVAGREDLKMAVSILLH
jgi:hypothetical protein